MTTPTPKRARVIDTVKFESLPDIVADGIVNQTKILFRHKSSVTRTLPLYTSNSRYEIMIHTFVGQKNASFATEMIIAQSYRHPAFFNTLLRLIPNFDMATLNSIVCHLKTGKNVCLKSTRLRETLPEIRKTLTAADIQSLPDRFDAILLPVDTAFLVMFHGGTVRRICSNKDSDTVRYKYVYHCDGPTGAHEAAAIYENKMMDGKVGNIRKPLWPHRVTGTPDSNETAIKIQTCLQTFGVVCIPLANEYLVQQTHGVAAHLATLMGVPDEKLLLSTSFFKHDLVKHPEWEFRVHNQKQSYHIHSATGYTGYGHTCETLKNMWKNIEFLVASAGIQGDITTAEIRVQF